MEKMNKSRHRYQNRVFSQLEGRAILVHPGLKKVVGTNNAVVWLSQILYWYDKGDKPGEIYKSRTQLEKETGLTRDQQIRAENRVKKLGIANITVRPGRPSPINHINIDFYVLEKLIRNVREISTLDERQIDRKTKQSMSLKKPHQRAQNTDNIPEITQKNIQNNNESGRSAFLANRKKLGL
jgi:hypothetical protein